MQDGRAPATEFRSDINALRAIAVLAVVFFHFGVPGFAGGFAGVDVFFVIAGYLITGQIVQRCASGRFSLRSFYLNRLRRIFPALALVCVVWLLWAWHHVLPRDLTYQARHAAAALFFVSNQAFAGERGYFDPTAFSKPLLHTWSLSVEAQFYLFLPLVLLALQRLQRWLRAPLRSALTVTALAVALVASLAWCILLSRATPGAAFYLLLTRAWELLAGGLLALWQRQRTPPPALANAGAVLALSVLLGSLCLLNESLAWPGYWTVLPVSAAVLFLAMQDAPLLRALLRLRPLQWLGDISYSLYLWHWPLLLYLRDYEATRGHALQPAELLALMVMSLLTAAASWKWIELPTRFQRQRWTDARLLTGALATALLFLAVGATVVATQGAPRRLPDYVQRANDAIFLNTPRDECFREGDSSKRAPEPFCTMGATAGTTAPSLVLWGDSHANQYLSAVSAAAAALGRQGLIATQSGCSAAQTSTTDSTPAQRSCRAFNRQVRTLIDSTPAIRTVVLGRFWGPADGGSVAANLALVRDLVAHGKQVVLVGPLPYPDYDVPHAWSVEQIRAGHAVDAVTLDAADQHAVQAMNAALMAGLHDAVQAGQAAYIDMFDRLCDARQCRLVEGGQSNFRDNAHLSEYAARQTMPLFTAALSSLHAR